MLKRQPKVTKFKWSQVFRNIIYVEFALLIGSFYVYKKLCRDQNFRFTCHRHCRPLLNGFYSFMDLIGHDYYRVNDYEKWRINDK